MNFGHAGPRRILYRNTLGRFKNEEVSFDMSFTY